MGCFLCCMALSASDIYRLTVEQLRQACVENGLDSDGPVRILRRRLGEQIKQEGMEPTGVQDITQVGAPTDLLSGSVANTSPYPGEQSQRGGEAAQVPVLVELLRQVAPLSSEEPEEILRLFVRVGEIYDLGLTDDRQFITRMLPLVSGSILKLLGSCLRGGCSWPQCKVQLLEEYFPYFVRERLVRDLIVFKFHVASEPLREYIERISQAATFLQYAATEQQLVDRILTNLDPDILAQAAFLDRPKTIKDLNRVVGLIEERISASRERLRANPHDEGESRGGRKPRDAPRQGRGDTSRVAGGTVKCWGCGQMGHYQRACPQRNQRSGNGQGPGGQRAPGPSF